MHIETWQDFFIIIWMFSLWGFHRIIGFEMEQIESASAKALIATLYYSTLMILAGVGIYGFLQIDSVPGLALSLVQDYVVLGFMYAAKAGVDRQATLEDELEVEL